MQALTAVEQNVNETEVTGSAWGWEPGNHTSDPSATATVNMTQDPPRTELSEAPVHPTLRPTTTRLPLRSAKPGSQAPVQDWTKCVYQARSSGSSHSVFSSSFNNPPKAIATAGTKCGEKKYANSQMTKSTLFDYDEPLSPHTAQRAARGALDLRDLPPAFGFMQDNISEEETSIFSKYTSEELLTDDDDDVHSVGGFVSEWVAASVDSEEDPAHPGMPFLRDCTFLGS